MFMGLTGLHLLIIVGVVVLLFGATRLPALAKGLGESLRILRQESRADGVPADEVPGAAGRDTVGPGTPEASGGATEADVRP